MNAHEQQGQAATPDNKVADFAEAQERKGKVCFKLEYPVEWGEETITELWMRRPTLLDKAVAERQSTDDYELTEIILGHCCGVEPELIGEMDELYDQTKLIERFNKFNEEADIEGENTLVLRYPIEINGQPVTKLTMRRPRGRDNKDFKDLKLGAKMAMLCGYEEKDLHDMDLKTDWAGLEEIYLSFRQRRPQRR